MLPLLQELHSPIMSCPDFMDHGVLLLYGHGSPVTFIKCDNSLAHFVGGMIPATP